MVLIFDLILALIALAALWQLAKIIFYTICRLGCQFFWLAIWVLETIFALGSWLTSSKPAPPPPPTNVIPFKRHRA
jgi:hypothetical protein